MTVLLPAVLLEVVSNHFAGLLTNHVIQMKHFVNAARSSDPRCSNSLEATWLYTTQTQMSLFITLYIILFAFKFAVNLHRKRAMTFLVPLLIQASDQRRIQLLRVIASHDQQTAGCVYYTIQRVEDTSQVQGIPAISRRVTMGTNRAPNSSTWCQIATRPKDSNGLTLTSRSVPVFQSMIILPVMKRIFGFIQLRCLFSSRGWHPAYLAVILNQRFLSHLEPLQLHQPLDWLCNGSDQLISPTALD